jgi:hypothetical protein
MTVKSHDDLEKRAVKESRFYKALRGVDNECIDDMVPLVVKFIANEMSLLGESFIRQTMEQHAVVDESDSNTYISINNLNIEVLIDLDSFILFMRKFTYICN